MKICIFGYQRSGSSFLNNTLAIQYNLDGIGEIFTGVDPIDNSPYDIMKKDNIVVKIHAHNLISWDFYKIDWSIFDQVWIIQRKNPTDALCSGYIAAKTNRYKENAPRQKFTVDMGYFIDWSREMIAFFKYKSEILKIVKDPKFVYYEDIMTQQSKSEIYSPSNFDYKVDCENYTELEKRVNYLMSKLENNAAHG
jgi:hypothetical protein